MNFIFFLILILMALAILAFPFLKNPAIPKRYFIFTSLFIMVFSAGLYFFTTNFSVLNEWENHGKQHYQLLVEYQELGGIDGMITKIKAKLQLNPNDAQGWFILGKLYLMKNDKPNAKKALGKAHQLDPNNGQIEYFYNRL